ncbi:efflux RND transporter permease subunit [Novosphingobium sp. MD-1]|uniref:efflux RND transporter permease subunit n=1 Tax=Novosphingobium sp. MD-1 TaxID=1630648 RepID=UPI00061CD377|nr:efflux RND transporter permease subunit [Novosphingobium sp. MD-1]GAO56795.1 RND multidrug efflux transporter [Novosphingobium sp. MD-1]
MSFNPAAFALARWQFTLVAIVLLAALGLAALLTIPRTEDPQLDPPIFIINAVLPGASPSEVEELVTRPVEDAVYRLDGIREVRSRSTDGLSVTRIEFNWGTNPESSYDKVTREVSALRASLPQGLQRLDIVRGRPINVSIVEVALVSEYLPMRRLEKVADRLRERLGTIPGINEARYWGAGRTEMRVSLDMARLASLRLSPTAVTQALRAAGEESPLGAVNAAARRFTVKYGGAFRSPEDIAAVPVLPGDGRALRVGNVAQVAWAQDDHDHITRFNGQRALLVTATQAKDQDVTRLSASINAELDAFERTLPGGVKLVRGFDQSENVKHRIGGLTRDFLIALVLVSLTLLPLGLRAAGVVMIAIPLSLLIGVGILAGLGFTLNQLAIAGFVLALGILVDDAIVVVENIARWLREGADRTTAVIKGTGQIALAVLGCTACLVFAFVPLLALPEASGEFIRSLPVAVIATVLGSLIVAFAMTPLAARLLLSRDEHPEGNKLLQAVQRGIHRFYAPVLHRALDRPRRWMIGLLLLCVLSLPLAKVIGSSLFPPAETPQFLVRVEMPQGTAQRRTDQAVSWVEHVVSARSEVRWTSANVGRGNPQLYYNVAQRETDPAFGEVAVGLKAWEPGKSEALLADLRRRFDSYPGARISIVTFVNGPEIEAPIVVRISGPDVARLAALSRKAEAVMADVPGVRDIGNPLRQPRTDLHLAVDEAAASALGVAPGAIRDAVRTALSGSSVASFRDADGDDYVVTVRLPNAGRSELAHLGKIFVPTKAGASAPLSALATPELRSEAARIDRLRRARMVTLTAYTAPGVLVSKATAQVLDRVKAEVDLPPGYSISLGGEAETSSRSFAGLVPAIVVSSLGILAVLVLEFGRFRTVAVVAGIVPFGFLGAIVALWLTGNSLSFTAAVGLIALVGIEIKNSILLVDFTEQLERDGLPVREAVERAGELRFLPVLLTSVTAIGGLLPLAVENSGLFSPMAIAMIGGLVSSTLLARIATPVMYLLLAGKGAGRRPEEMVATPEGLPA